MTGNPSTVRACPPERKHGFSLAESLTFSAITTIGAVPGALLAWPISDRFGRKAPAAVVAVVIRHAAVRLYPRALPPALRNTGAGFAYGIGRLANIVGPLVVAAIFTGAGYVWVFVYIGACWLVVAAAIEFFGPRSGRAGLEELEAHARR